MTSRSKSRQKSKKHQRPEKFAKAIGSEERYQSTDPPLIHGYKELELPSGLLGLRALLIPLSERL